MPAVFQPLVRAPLSNIRQWMGIAWMETIQSYRRTVLGPFWITLNLVIFTVAMTLVYGALFSIPTREYAAYLACGMIAWTWAVALLTELGNTFAQYGAFVKGSAFDKSIFIWTAVFKQVIILLHNLIVYVGLVIIGVVDISLWTLFLFPAVLVMFFISIPIVAITAILYARYRDLQRLVSSTMIVFLMITPIFWQPTMIKGWRTALYLFNPFYYLVEFMRAPLLGQAPDPFVVSVVLGLFAAFWFFGARFYARYEKYAVFWV